MNDRLRLRQMRYFVEVARNGSIGKAAEICAVSQPAVTRQIHELEQSLGASLFTRSRSGVAPTRRPGIEARRGPVPGRAPQPRAASRFRAARQSTLMPTCLTSVPYFS